jgi:hypothetical protein
VRGLGCEKIARRADLAWGWIVWEVSFLDSCFPKNSRPENRKARENRTLRAQEGRKGTTALGDGKRVAERQRKLGFDEKTRNKHK